MAMRSELGIYFLGHPTTLNRILYMLCSPKARFTPELNDEYSEYNVSGSDLQALKNFIKNGGADTFRNSINRQKFVPVTQADIEIFLFGERSCYQEVVEPWSASKVNFSNLFGMCMLDESEYIRILSDGLVWKDVGGGVYRVSRTQEAPWNGNFSYSYDEIFSDSPKCNKIELMNVSSHVGYEQKILHISFGQDREDVAFALAKMSRMARRFGTKMLFYFDNRYDGDVSWFYSDCKVVEQTEANSLAIEELHRRGLEKSFSHVVFKHGPKDRGWSYVDEEQNSFDPIAEAINHVEQSRD